MNDNICILMMKQGGRLGPARDRHSGKNTSGSEAVLPGLQEEMEAIVRYVSLFFMRPALKSL